MSARKGLRVAAGAAVLGGGVAWSLPALAPICTPVAGALGIPRRLEGAPGVAVTFDDGPHPQGTPAVLEALAARDAVATFFLVGEQVDAYPTLAREIADAGHAIAIHGYRHRNLLRVPPRALADDLDRAAATIAEATGVAPQVHRPPYGIYSPAGMRLVARRGWAALLWSHWGRDWAARATATSITELVARDLTAGDVLLLHDADWYSDPDSWRATAEAVPRVLDRIAAAGLATVRV